MEEWWTQLPGTAQGALILLVIAPYVGLATGRIVPRWVAEQIARTWKDLYVGGEQVRVRSVEAAERGADAMEDTAALVRSVLEPLREAAQREDHS